MSNLVPNCVSEYVACAMLAQNLLDFKPAIVSAALYFGLKAVSPECGTGLLGILMTLPCMTTGRWLMKHVLRQPVSIKKYGKWACVTGATDGIGKAYAFELASKGLNLLIISRTQSKLDTVAEEIRSASNVKVETLAVDMSAITDENKAAIQAKVDEHEFGVLINNVGMSYPSAMYFHETTSELQEKLLAINCQSILVMTHMFLKKMKDRKKGFIINISSGASLAPQGLYAGYGACKNFVNKLTNSLAHEYTSKGVIVQAQTPYYVVSKLSKMRHASFFVPSPKNFVKSALKHVGHPGVITPYFPHAIINIVVENMPRKMAERFMDAMQQPIRKKYIKKLAKQGKTL